MKKTASSYHAVKEFLLSFPTSSPSARSSFGIGIPWQSGIISSSLSSPSFLQSSISYNHQSQSSAFLLLLSSPLLFSSSSPAVSASFCKPSFLPSPSPPSLTVLFAPYSPPLWSLVGQPASQQPLYIRLDSVYTITEIGMPFVFFPLKPTPKPKSSADHRTNFSLSFILFSLLNK